MKDDKEKNWRAGITEEQHAQIVKGSLTFSIGDKESGEYAERKVFYVDVGDVSSDKVKGFFADMNNEIMATRFDDAMELIA